ncbi:hypothetical protein DPX16_4060 [Anabarilius grahami]|uniref:Uncharacterized protein n=1 Tax=Anabarilius grahami TaxID=495550 RepID=A0A3N0XY73_ANAGA|nr:hypothetical protein DPX16_4060 [Anabarilius grahami]
MKIKRVDLSFVFKLAAGREEVMSLTFYQNKEIHFPPLHLSTAHLVLAVSSNSASRLVAASISTMRIMSPIRSYLPLRSKHPIEAESDAFAEFLGRY